MKKLLLIFVLLNSLCLATTKSPNYAMLITYPRTGTNFLMYSMKHLAYNNNKCTSKVVKRIRNCHGFEYYCQRRNRIFRLDYFRPNQNYLIVLVRNYKEAFLRNFSYNIEKIYSHIKDDSLDSREFRYFNLFKHYEQWNPEKRLLIYYEDLMKNPKKELTRVAKFLKTDNSLLVKYLDNLDFHIEESKRLYNQAHGYIATKSNGTDQHFHSNKIAPEILKEMERLAQVREPSIYKKYLKRYELQAD